MIRHYYKTYLILHQNKTCRLLHFIGQWVTLFVVSYMFYSGFYWLLPIIIVILIFGGLIILSQGAAVAPFIYTIF